jgi:hypothetical protein
VDTLPGSRSPSSALAREDVTNDGPSARSDGHGEAVPGTPRAVGASRDEFFEGKQPS